MIIEDGEVYHCVEEVYGIKFNDIDWDLKKEAFGYEVFDNYRNLSEVIEKESSDYLHSVLEELVCKTSVKKRGDFSTSSRINMLLEKATYQERIAND